MKDLKLEYNAFFKAKGGQHLLDVIGQVIASNHIKAEQDPKLSRDYVQRAKGAREVLDHIQSVLGAKEKNM